MFSELISRLEKAPGPSRVLDFEIHIAAVGDPLWPATDMKGRITNPNSRMSDYLATYRDVIDSDDQDFDFPRYTASLDAAMTLMKPGDYDFSLARTTRGGPEFTEWQARIALDTVEDDPDETGPQALGEGHTAPPACCIAFLKAHSRSVEEPKE